MKRGPIAGSDGALRIAEAHRGSHDHDKMGGFAACPERAAEAGRKGGEECKSRYGLQFFRVLGIKGGETVKRERGSEFYAEIGRRGGLAKARNRQKQEVTTCGGLSEEL